MAVLYPTSRIAEVLEQYDTPHQSLLDDLDMYLWNVGHRKSSANSKKRLKAFMTQGNFFRHIGLDSQGRNVNFKEFF